MNLLLLNAAVTSFPYATAAVSLMVIGFVAATTLGSIAWYNSKRPVGWKDKERPDFVPDIES